MRESREVQGQYLPDGVGTWLSVSRAQRQSSMRVRAAQKDMLTPRHKLRYVLKLFAGGSGPVGTTCTSSACFHLLVLVLFVHMSEWLHMCVGLTAAPAVRAVACLSLSASCLVHNLSECSDICIRSKAVQVVHAVNCFFQLSLSTLWCHSVCQVYSCRLASYALSANIRTGPTLAAGQIPRGK